MEPNARQGAAFEGISCPLTSRDFLAAIFSESMPCRVFYLPVYLFTGMTLFFMLLL